MADDSELDYLIKFIDEATTGLTVKSFETIRKVEKIAGVKKCLIEPGELLSVDSSFYKKRFKVKLSVATEIVMTSIINEIVEGIITYNKRGAGFTFPVTMCNIKFIYSNKSYIDNNRWLNDIYLDVEWVTS